MDSEWNVVLGRKGHLESKPGLGSWDLQRSALTTDRGGARETPHAGV
jgi:hypothetical protein